MFCHMKETGTLLLLFIDWLTIPSKDVHAHSLYSWNLQSWSSVGLTSWRGLIILNTYVMPNFVLLPVASHHGLFVFTRHFLWFVFQSSVFLFHLQKQKQIYYSYVWLMESNFPEQECVPVILSDQVELPFQDVVDYSKISIKLPSTSIGPQLLDYLGSIPGRSTAFFVTFYFKIPFLPSHDWFTTKFCLILRWRHRGDDILG